MSSTFVGFFVYRIYFEGREEMTPSFAKTVPPHQWSNKNPLWNGKSMGGCG